MSCRLPAWRRRRQIADRRASLARVRSEPVRRVPRRDAPVGPCPAATAARAARRPELWPPPAACRGRNLPRWTAWRGYRPTVIYSGSRATAESAGLVFLSPGPSRHRERAKSADLFGDGFFLAAPNDFFLCAESSGRRQEQYGDGKTEAERQGSGNYLQRGIGWNHFHERIDGPG